MERLPIAPTAVEAAWRCWGLRRELLRAIAVPSIAFLALTAAMPVITWPSPLVAFVWGMTEALILAFAALSCHRMMLLGPVSIAKFGVDGHRRRDWKFVAGAFYVWFALSLLISLTEFALSLLGTNWMQLKALGGIEATFIGIAISQPALYVVSRQSLLLPAIAVDMPTGGGWRLSRNNGWRLTLLVGGLPWLINACEGSIASLFPRAITHLAHGLLYVTFLPLEVALLSVSYRRLLELGDE